LAKAFDDRCRCRYPYGTLAFIRRSQIVSRRRSHYQLIREYMGQNRRFDNKLGRNSLFNGKKPAAALRI
jgi:hypothetical protein